MTTRRDFLKVAAAAPWLGLGGAVELAPGNGALCRKTQAAFGNGEPIYLGRTLDEWLVDFLNAENDDDATPPCQALPCFGMAFTRRASQVIRAVDGWKQAQLANCLADTGTQAVPILRRLLKNPSARVRALACRGLEQALKDEFYWPPAAMKMIRRILSAPPQSHDEQTMAADNLDAAFAMPDSREYAHTKVLVTIMDCLDDEHPAVRFAAIETLGSGIYPKKIASAVVVALSYAMNDSHPDVRQYAAQMLAAGQIAEHVTRQTQREAMRMITPMDDAARREWEEELHAKLTQAIKIHDADPNGFEELCPFATGSPLPETVAKARDAMRHLADAPPDCVAAALRDRDIAIRIAAINVLARIDAGDFYVAPCFFEMLSDVCSHVRRNAKVALLVRLFPTRKSVKRFGVFSGGRNSDKSNC